MRARQPVTVEETRRWIREEQRPGHRLRAGKEVRLPAHPVDLVMIREALIEANAEHAP